MSVTIYHNPECGTSRNTLAMIRQSGVEPQIIEYLKSPPTRQRLVALLQSMNMKPRDLLREKGTPYASLGLDDLSLSDDQLIDAILAHPILMNRPIVVTDKGVKLCRPSEAVLEILPNPHLGRFTKEDGEVIEAPYAGPSIPSLDAVASRGRAYPRASSSSRSPVGFSGRTRPAPLRLL